MNRYHEAKAHLRQMMPVARRVLGEGRDITLNMRTTYSCALFDHGAATRADIREAVTTLEDSERVGRRVLGGNHPVTLNVEKCLRAARDALRASDDFSDDACITPVYE